MTEFAMTLRRKLLETAKRLVRWLCNASANGRFVASPFVELEADQKQLSDAQWGSCPAGVTFQGIPPECQLRVFSYLTVEERGRAERVCAQWRDLIRTPLLWKCVDLTQFSLHCQCSSHSCSNANCYDSYKHRMERFLDYLSRIRPYLREFRFAFDIIDCQDDWLRLLRSFVDSVHVDRLEVAQLNWKETPEKPYPSENATWSSNNYNDLMYRHRRRQRLFITFFDYFTASAANVSTLILPFDWSVPSIRLLKRLSRLQSLTLDSYFVPQTFQQETLDALFSAVPNVKHLSLSVCFGSGFLSFRFSSKNLRSLDLSRCQGLCLDDVCLPSLTELRTSRPCVGPSLVGHGAASAVAALPCIYQVLCTGAPALRQLNGHRLHSEWRETVSVEMESQLRCCCCPCPQHRPSFSQPSSSSSFS